MPNLQTFAPTEDRFHDGIWLPTLIIWINFEVFRVKLHPATNSYEKLESFMLIELNFDWSK